MSLMKNGRFAHLLFLMLSLVLGLQAIRLLLPLLLYVVSDNFGFASTLAGGLAFIVFASSFLGGWLRRRVSLPALWRLSALSTGLCLALASLFFQAIAPTLSPLIAALPLLLVMLAVAAFIQFLPHYLLQTAEDTAGFALTFLLGLAADTTLHGLMATYDFAWHSPAVAIALLLAQLILLSVINQPVTKPVTLQRSWLLLIIGPYLFLQLLLFQNIARLMAVTSWSSSLVFAWAVLVHIAGLVTAVYLLRQTRLIPFYWLLLSFLLFLSIISDLSGLWAAGQLLIGQIGAAGLLTLGLTGLRPEHTNGRAKTGTTAYSLGLILMTAITFLYYISYQLPLPFVNSILLSLAAILVIGLTAVGLSVRPAPPNTQALPIWLPFLLFLAPIYTLATSDSPTATPGPGYPIRLMTYNLHNGFNTLGYLGLEAIAQTIEAQQPDIVALQEVSRGWVVNGSADMLAWLSQRLDMPYVFGPTADALLGNALLSKYPIAQYQLHPLPTPDLPYQRGFISAAIAIGGNQSLNIIATHFHHLADDSPIRQQQAQAILDFVQAQPHTVIMGDLNATPDTPEMMLIRQSGFNDILADVEANETFPARNPTRQIDYIWLTPDLTAATITIPHTLASDHLALATTVQP